MAPHSQRLRLTTVLPLEPGLRFAPAGLSAQNAHNWARDVTSAWDDPAPILGEVETFARKFAKRIVCKGGRWS